MGNGACGLSKTPRAAEGEITPEPSASVAPETADLHPASVHLPDELLAPEGASIDDLVRWVYEDRLNHGDRIDAETCAFFEKRCIVTPTNEAAAAINNRILDVPPEPLTHVYTTDMQPHAPGRGGER